MGRRRKRNGPSTPSKETEPTGEVNPTSPTKQPIAKRLFQGDQPMDVEGLEQPPAVDEREARRRERAARIALQKQTGIKQKAGGTGKGEKDDPIELNNDDVSDEEGGDEEGGDNRKPPAAKPQRSRSSTAREKRGRGRSVPSRKGGNARRSSRAASADSAFTTVSGKGGKRSKSKSKAKNAGSDESSGSKSGEKRKMPPKKTPVSSKSAKFQDGIPNNEGKTASTKKHAKAKKAGTSYAEKTKAKAKTEWCHSTVVNWFTKLGKCSSTKQEVYGRLASALTVLLNYDPECAFGCLLNSKAPPLRSAAELKFKFHGDFKRYFSIQDETPWQWDDGIKADKPRSFSGSLILLSDKPPAEIFEFCGVDLRCEMKGYMEPKKIQEVKTETSLILLGVHANAFANSVAADFQAHLRRAELDMLDNKKLYEKEGVIPYDKAYEAANEDWRNLAFPDIVGSRSCPKGGGYEESIPGVDTSWKLAVHFTTASEAMGRINLVLDYFVAHGYSARLFGSQAAVERLAAREDTSGKDEFLKLLPDHQNTNRSVGNITLTGVIDIDAEASVYTEQETPGKTRWPKTMTLRDILRKMYVKIDNHKYPVFLYCFKNYGGKYVLWFWDTVHAMREFVEMFRMNAAAYMWHRIKDWGWDMSTVKVLFRRSFDSTTAINAMNSKWNKSKQRAIVVATGSEAATRLGLGTSPFILRTGEDKDSRIKPPKVQRSNLEPDTGGADIDDMQSVGDQSDTETVYHSDEDEDSDDDDVSMMGDDEGFDDVDGAQSDAEETKARDSDDSSDSDDEEEDSNFYDGDESTKGGATDDDMEVDSDEEDSAFSTKASDKKAHRKPPDKRDDEIAQLKAEKEQMKEIFQKEMEMMRMKFKQEMEFMLAQGMERQGLAQGSAPSPVTFNATQTQSSPSPSTASPGGQRPGASVGDDQQGANLAGETDAGASAAIK